MVGEGPGKAALGTTHPAQLNLHLKPAIRRLLCLLLSLCLAFTPLELAADIYQDLPDMGAASGSVLTPLQERQLGKAFMRYIRATQKVIDDPLLDDYINTLGMELVNHSEARGTRFTFFLVEDPQINAYAGPGGYIGVYTGLVLTTRSENELAAVLAHEITHVVQKHLLRAFHENRNLSLVQGAALLAAILVGTLAGGDAGLAAAIGTQAAIQQQQINFTRQNEKEADRIGIDIMQQAGFDPRAMPTFFARMGRANSAYATSLPEFLRTHPVTNARIADALGRAETYSYRQHEDSLRYLLARAAIREMTFQDPADAIIHFRSALKEGRFRSQAAARYGYALALHRAERHDQAAKEMETLLKQHPQVVEFLVTASRIDMDRGKRKLALKRLEKAKARLPYNYPLRITLAELYLRAGKPRQAQKELLGLRRSYPDKTRIYRLLARASADQGRQGESHQYMASYYYLMGLLEPARLQLEIALRQPNLEEYERARIQSQLQQVKSEIEQLKREEKKH